MRTCAVDMGQHVSLVIVTVFTAGATTLYHVGVGIILLLLLGCGLSFTVVITEKFPI